MPTELQKLHQRIGDCEKCPRLRKHCLTVAREKRRSYQDETYWGKPIPGFGDPGAELVLIGLAPAAHGANRTGRIFTGDRSGDWLYRALHRAGFANQATSTARNDGLKLKNAYISCAARCAPPQNKPTPAELKRCAPFLEEELGLLKNAKVFMALGQIGLNTLWPFISKGQRKPTFGHGEYASLADGRHLVMSYHPSQQNTFTGRLTEPMFDAVFTRAQNLLCNRGQS